MIYPMFAVVLLIVMVGVLNLYWRVSAVRNRSVRARYFKTFQTDEELPENIIAGGRNYSNLFEVPILFLISCTLVIVLEMETATFVLLAWVFVASRIAHSVIHLSYNHILHRMLVFNVGLLVVLAMWVLILLQVKA